MDSDYIEIGRITKTHGYKGELKTSLAVDKLQDIENVKVFYFKEGNSFVPYFINRITAVSENTAIIDFESLDSKESAALVVGYTLYASVNDVNQMVSQNDKDFTDYVGYSIIDKTLGNIGSINEVVVHPHQIFAILKRASKEILIPLHAELIHEIHDQDKKIMMNLPEGILDL